MRTALLLIVLLFPLPTLGDDLQAALARPIDVSWQQVTLRQALGELRAVGRINVVVDWNGLEWVGIEPETRISLQLEQVPMWLVLDLIGQQVSQPDLIWQARGNAVLLLTENSRLFQYETRVYDVGHLIGLSPGPSPQAHLVRMADTRYRETRSGGPVMDPNAPDSTHHQMMSLCEVIQQSVSPDTWVDHGGTSTLTAYRGRLVVRAPPRVHLGVERLLVQMTDPEAVPRRIENAGANQLKSTGNARERWQRVVDTR